MISGNRLRVQVGKETTYGVVATGQYQIKVSSEGFKLKLNKKDEGVLTGGKTSGIVATMSKSTEGTLAFLARPDDIGLFLKACLGIEDAPTLVQGSSNAYKHTFKAIGTSLTDHLPSLTVLIDRIAQVLAYNGCKVQSLAFSAAPEDFLKIDANFVGKDESSGTLATLTPSLLKAFKFHKGKVKINAVEYADVTSIKFNYNNNLINNLQTTGTGLYFYEPEVGTREITAELEVLFNASSINFRNSYYLTDNDLSLELEFTSEENIEPGYPYKLTITIPHMQVNETNPTIGGGDVVKQTIALKAIEVGSDELITIDLINSKQTAY